MKRDLGKIWEQVKNIEHCATELKSPKKDLAEVWGNQFGSNGITSRKEYGNGGRGSVAIILGALNQGGGCGGGGGNNQHFEALRGKGPLGHSPKYKGALVEEASGHCRE